MSAHENETPIGFYEGRLQDIAQTSPWDEDDIMGNARNYQAMLQTVRDKIEGVRTWVKDSGDLDCAGRDQMAEKAQEMVEQLDIHHAANAGYLSDLQQLIQDHNNGIKQARNADLPGDRLDAESARQIMDAAEPMDVVVLGLTLTGLMGPVGVIRVSQLLSRIREDKARQEYETITSAIKGIDLKLPEPIPVVDMPKVEEPDPEEHEGVEQNGSSGGLGVAAGAGAVAAAGAGVAASGAGRQGVAGAASPASPVAKGSGNATALGGGALSRSGGVASGSAMSSGSLPVGGDRMGGSSGGGGYRRSDDGDDNYLYRWDADGTYRYDPDKDAWVHTDARGVDVDSYSMQGISGLSSVTSGTGVAAAGAAAVGIAGRAGAASSAAAGSLMGVAGAGSGLGAVGGGASGVGSFYANNPVAATISPSSSIRGAQGLAAGLRSNSAAAGAAAAGGRANPAMMGGMGAGGNGGDGKKRQRLGYVAPVIEEEEEFAPMPIGNMAGHRRIAGEA